MVVKEKVSATKTRLLPRAYALSHYELVLTWDCNLSCRYCYEKTHDVKVNLGGNLKEMSVEDFLTFVERTYDRRAPRISFCFFGGEAFLKFNKIKEYVVALRKLFDGKKPLSFSTTTNATTLNKERMDFIIENKIGVLVSLDGGRETTDYNRGQGTFDKVMEKLSYFYSKNYRVSIRLTIDPQNLPRLNSDLELLDALGVDYWWEVDTGVPWQQEDLLLLHDALQQQHLRRSCDLTLNKFANRGTRYCINPLKNITVVFNGELRICSGIDEVIGDIYQGISTQTYRRLRNKIYLYGQMQLAACGQCPTYQYCKGGCVRSHLLGQPAATAYDYRVNPRFCNVQHLLNIIREERNELRRLNDGV